MKDYILKYTDNGNRTDIVCIHANSWREARKKSYDFMKRHNGKRIESLLLNY